MSDDAPPRPKTVPGFGHPQQPLPPLEVQSVEFDEPTLTDIPSAAPEAAPGSAAPGSAAPQRPEAAPQRERRSGELRVVGGSFPMPRPTDERAGPKGPPAVEIDLVYEHRTSPLPDSHWCFLEIWTRNTIYQLDSALECIDVMDLATRRSIADHPLRGARLVGGQSYDGEGMELSHPFPRPGSEAVFEQASGRNVRFSQTSTVTRVVMRLRVLKVEPERLLPTWEEVSGSWDRRSGRPRT
jgi:hypothetical protein